jgi:hypothetical protein
VNWILNLLFGCRHGHRSWPRKAFNGSVAHCYRICLDCGKHLPYKFAAVETARAERSARG